MVQNPINLKVDNVVEYKYTMLNILSEVYNQLVQEQHSDRQIIMHVQYPASSIDRLFTQHMNITNAYVHDILEPRISFAFYNLKEMVAF